MNFPTITWGLLGWSNKRSGVEFYRWDELRDILELTEKTIPRHESEWGDLLALEDDAVKDAEGSPVLVIVFPRGATKVDLLQATYAIQKSIPSLAASPDTEEGT